MIDFRKFAAVVFIAVLLAATGTALASRGRRIEEWNGHSRYFADDLVSYRGETYRCLQSHNSQSDWAPPTVSALWVKYDLNSWEEHTRYRRQDLVTYRGGIYHCLAGHTASRGNEPISAPSLWAFWDYLSWDAQVSYQVGSVVMYRNTLYECRQAHTSQSDWPPDLTPALWLQVSRGASAKVELFVLDHRGQSVGSGFLIRVDGRDAGSTDRFGAITLVLADGLREITADNHSGMSGRTMIQVSSGQSYEHYLYLEHDCGWEQNSALVVEELEWEPIPWDFNGFTMRFDHDRRPVRLHSVFHIDVVDPRTGRIYEVNDLFEIGVSGELEVRWPNRFQEILRGLGGDFFELIVEGQDQKGNTHYGRVTINLGRGGLSLW